MMATVADAHWNGLKVVAESWPEHDQRDRILEALGSGSHIARVDEESHTRYYKYLTEHLCFPFTVHYPEPTTSLEEVQYRCTVLELLDPARFLGGEFDGIFSKTCKGTFEVNLPLIELEVPDDSPNFQFIEDYWYWFWNWR
jgi:hypothetical protein